MRKTSFVTDTLKLALGTTFTQALGLLLSPIFARIFAPEAFGVAAIFTALIGILQVIACLRYELTIMLPASDEEAGNQLALSVLAVLVISSLVALIFWVGGPQIAHGLAAPDLLPYLWMGAPALFFTGIFAALNQWGTRRKYFGHISLAQVVNSLVSLGGRLGWGLVWAPTGGVIIGANYLGTASSTVYLVSKVWQQDRRDLRENFSWSAIWRGAKRYYKFPLYNTWSSLLNTMSWQLPVFVLSIFFSPVIVGYYALGNRVISLPMSLIGGSIAQVFYQRAAAAATEGALALVVENVFRTLVAFALFPLLVLAIVGDDLFTIALGATWTEAGVYSQILALWTFFWFISSPLSSLYNLHDRQESLLGIQSAIFLSRLIALLIGGWLGSPRWCLALFGFSGVLVYGYMSLSILENSGVSKRKMLHIFLYNLRLFSPFGALLIGLKLFQATAWITVSAAIICCSLYALYLVRTDERMRQVAQRFLPKKLGI